MKSFDVDCHLRSFASSQAPQPKEIDVKRDDEAAARVVSYDELDL